MGVTTSTVLASPPPPPPKSELRSSRPRKGEGRRSVITANARLSRCRNAFRPPLLTGNGICTGFSILVPRMQGWEQREPRASLEITRQKITGRNYA